MKLELDKRIESLSDIFNFSDVQNAKQFIGQKGYFTNNIYGFGNIQSCLYGTLIHVFPNNCFPNNIFRRKEDGAYYEFFIPESFLKPKEKKYRPYTLEEFQKIFTIGQPIKFRFIGINTEKTLLLIGYEIFYEDNNPETYILIGYETFKLDELLEEYEWQEPGSNVWKPFGVEE